MDFMQQMQAYNAENSVSYTENGGAGYATTGKALLDLNFAVSSFRNRSEQEIASAFAEAYRESPENAIVWLFFARDIRGGMGERRLFRACMRFLAKWHKKEAVAVLDLLPEYGRWDDLVCMLNIPEVKKEVFSIIRKQLLADIQECNKKNGQVSLLGKWIPSEHCRKRVDRAIAQELMSMLGWSPRKYRKELSALRRKIDVVERKMSANEWQEIKYPNVPSKANLIYSNAFLRHDEERRKMYLGQLSRGETKINVGTLYPHDIVHKYMYGKMMLRTLNLKIDPAIEEMWKALPDFVDGDETTLVVADGSGSMFFQLGSTQTTAWEVAHALALYFAERASAPYKDMYITFSSHPQFVNLKNTKSLVERIACATKYNEPANTDIEAVFELILNTAVKNHTSQTDMPKNILIISDMEFDECAKNANMRVFDSLKMKYQENGYELPRLVFWNVCSRTNTIPLTQNKNGVVLVSGFSPAVLKMVYTGKLDPWECLIDTLKLPRYEPVWKALEGA